MEIWQALGTMNLLQKPPTAPGNMVIAPGLLQIACVLGGGAVGTHCPGLITALLKS